MKQLKFSKLFQVLYRHHIEENPDHVRLIIEEIGKAKGLFTQLGDKILEIEEGSRSEDPDLFVDTSEILYGIWMSGHNRSLWRLTPKTFETISDTRLNFIPPEPPAGWDGQEYKCVIAEPAGNSQLLLGKYSSIASFWVPDHKNHCYSYWVLLVDKDFVASQAILPIHPDFIRENEKVFEKQPDIWKALQFLLALGYYNSSQDLALRILAEPGPIKRTGKKNKPVKNGKGEVVRLWNYYDLKIDTERVYPSGESAPLDKERLNLEPTWVRPHFRKSGKFVAAYHSHRWRKPSGIKKKI